MAQSSFLDDWAILMWIITIICRWIYVLGAYFLTFTAMNAKPNSFSTLSLPLTEK